ncbi:hypothetical protein ACKWTF_014279 [Chironomus riparius]
MDLRLTLCLLILIYGSSVLAGTAFCTFEHTSRYQSDLISDEITGYMCKLDLDIKGDRVNDVGGYHEGGERDNQVDIIKVLPDFYSYLTSFPETFCKRFNKLEIIDMSSTEIATIEDNSLSLCKDLRILQFYMNKIEIIPEKLLAENTKLLRLYITFNSIKTLPENLLNGLKELKILDLSYNKIDNLPDNIFKDLKNLKELNLEANKLEAIEPVLFENLEKLEKLNLNNNDISELPVALFNPFPNLKHLSLKDNNLTVIHADSFPQQANIDMVVLSNNKIKAIDEFFIDNCGVANLKMGGNVCDKSKTIKKKDMKQKLQTCFENYLKIQNDEDSEPFTITKPTTTTTKSTTTKPRTTTTTKPARTTTTITFKPTTTTTKATTTTTKATTTTLRTTTSTLEPTVTTSVPQRSPKGITALYEPCGVSKVGIPNVVNGIEINHGTHPWIAAIIYDNKYLCGGTLVTGNKVVTAAHCFHGKDIIEKQEDKTVVLLGAHQLDNMNEVGRVTVGVNKIIVNPKWNPIAERYDADIAILMLNEEVTFGYYIQPVCIAKISADIKNMHDGVIVGFGKSESSVSHENVPRKASTPIQKSENCFDKFPNMAGIASHRTFCGGNANGTGSCTGDSGGGLTVIDNGRHFLRGIVSASLYANKYGCDVNSYAIFTDVRFFTSFIKDSK